MAVADEVRLCSAECWMIRVMCGVKLADRVSIAGLYEIVSVDMAVQDVIVRNPVRWYSHVTRGGIQTQIREALQFEMAGIITKERPTKARVNYIKGYMEMLGLPEKNRHDSERWRYLHWTICRPLLPG